MIFLVILVSIVFIIKATATATPSTQVGHSPSEISQGIFGWEPNSQYTFQNNLKVDNILTTKDLDTTNSITIRGTTRNYWPYTECIQYNSGFIEPPDTGKVRTPVTVSCTAEYPVAFRGGCSSRCVWLERNEIVGNTQYCGVVPKADIIFSPNYFCTGSNQGQVEARITCCKV